jgi:GntR family transcriptional regulator, transcriptional repressor for pyruvate dehydrogenase complex
MFKSVARESSLTERAEQQIEELILSRALKGGDRLPSERDLGEKLGVSKTVVREAVRSLAAKGLIEVRTGSGMYVQHLGPELIAGPLNILLRLQALKPQEVHEVREVLEVTLAALAAERARPEHVAAMEAAVAALKAKPLTAARFAEADLAFHNALAEAADNPLFTLLVHSLNDVMLEVRRSAFRSDGERAARRGYRHHSKILAEVKARNVEGARRAMVDHLAEARSTLQRASAARGPGRRSTTAGKGRTDGDKNSVSRRGGLRNHHRRRQAHSG